jgi:rare lipoprotein A
MLFRRPVTLVVLTAAALALVGCSSSPRKSDGTSRAQKAGIYKVGQPYRIDGNWYYPAEDLNYDETGIASWYGEAFHAKDTANGEVFDLNALTAAHKTLPMPSIVQVTNLENGRAIQLRVNDRGPFVRGRIIDVSRRAAQLLGFENQGVAKVRVQILPAESIQVAAIARQGGVEPARAPLAADKPVAAPRDPVLARALPPGGAAAPEPSPAPPATITYTRNPGSAPAAAGGPSATAQYASATPAPPLSDTVSVMPIAPSRIWIQAGAFATAENLGRAQARLGSVGPLNVTSVKVSGTTIYRVRLGPAANVEEADRILAKVVGSGFPEARILVD